MRTDLILICDDTPIEPFGVQIDEPLLKEAIRFVENSKREYQRIFQVTIKAIDTEAFVVQDIYYIPRISRRTCESWCGLGHIFEFFFSCENGQHDVDDSPYKAVSFTEWNDWLKICMEDIKNNKDLDDLIDSSDIFYAPYVWSWKTAQFTTFMETYYKRLSLLFHPDKRNLDLGDARKQEAMQTLNLLRDSLLQLGEERLDLRIWCNDVVKMREYCERSQYLSVEINKVKESNALYRARLKELEAREKEQQAREKELDARLKEQDATLKAQDATLKALAEEYSLLKNAMVDCDSDSSEESSDSLTEDEESFWHPCFFKPGRRKENTDPLCPGGCAS